MSVHTLKLTKKQYDWINAWLELWGSWAYSGRLEKRITSVIAKYMEEADTTRVIPTRPMCNDDDGMLISDVVGRVMSIDKRALDILISYYEHGISRRAIARYYCNTEKPRRMSGRGGRDTWRKPSESTCRREIDDIIDASLFVLHEPLDRAFKMRDFARKSKKGADNWLTTVNQ